MPDPKLILTGGDPAGIGLDLICQLAHHPLNQACVIVCCGRSVTERASMLGMTLNLKPYQSQGELDIGEIWHLDLPCPNPCIAGEIDLQNSLTALQALDKATQACLHKHFDGLVTGPLHKAALNQAGVQFSGHTDYLQVACQVDQTLMLFVNDYCHLALVTTHLPLSHVATTLSAKHLFRALELLQQHYRKPRIAVLGLNPHAGEQGVLGHEEIDIISPTLNRAREMGIGVQGCFSADSFFLPENLARFDVVLSMYHDQALPVIKSHAFHHCVNQTLGLPFCRTSVDHGTALDLAGTGRANSASLTRAIHQALVGLDANE